MTFFEQYCEYYKPLLRRFCKDLTDNLPADSFKGIPHPHIPLWGIRYEQSLVKTAILGLETRGWRPELDGYIKHVENEQWDSSFENLYEFQDLGYLTWTDPPVTRHTFWGGVMFFLATLYGVTNWEILKHRKHTDILSSFVWGEACAIERWESAGVSEGTLPQAYSIAYAAAQQLNDYQHLKKLFAPQVTIIMCDPDYCNVYLRNTDKILKWTKPCGKTYARLWKAGNDLIINIPHPTYKKMSYAAPMVRQALIEEGYFQPFLPLMDCNKESMSLLNLNVFKRCNPKTTEVKDAIAYIATELRKQNAKMTVRLLCNILNQLGYRTKYGSEYQAGVGSYHTISLAYRRYKEGFHQEDIAEAIAEAFTKPNGGYAYEK